MFLQFVLAFLVLVAASYVGTTMALRGFFGREYYDQSGGRTPGDSSGTAGDPARTDDVPRASDVERNDADE